MSLEGQLTNERGTLKESYSRVKPETVQHSDEIQTDRLTDEGLRNVWFWTADFPMYRVEDDKGNAVQGRAVEDGEAVLYLARREHNLVFQNIEEATDQLIRTNNYVVENQEDIESMVNAESTVRIVLSNLGLKRHNDEFSYIELNTKTLAEGREAVLEQYGEDVTAFVDRVHGDAGYEKEGIGDLLAEKGRNITRIYVLNPEYVKGKRAIREGKSLARACWLDDFVYNSIFIADVHYVDISDGALRGVPVIAEGDAQNLEHSAQVASKEVTAKYTPEGVLSYMSAHKQELADAMQPSNNIDLAEVQLMYDTKQNQ